MRLPLLVLLLLFALATTGPASEEGTKKPGWLGRTARIFGSGKNEKERDRGSTVRVKNLTLTMTVTPEVVKLPETRQLQVTLSLANRSRRAVQLEFPTTQRIEILIKETDGKLVTQWSEDQAFENQTVFVMINPGERIEYNASIATRDLQAGSSYIVEGFFPHFDALRATKTITPIK
jgi:hypothetical protein